MPSSSPARPFSDAYLVAYSEEHVVYEFGMFLWLAQVCGSGAKLGAPSAADGTRLSNVLIESFVVHLRNVIDFLYLDRPKATDVVAADFFDPGAWERLRPAISGTLETARVRANKEMAHLTTDRIAGSPPEKAWDFSSLATEIRLLMRLVARNALAARLSPRVSAVIR
jgi:hypothetical protein